MYSIGNGSRKWDDFVSLLRLYGIQYLIDVRSRPGSRFHPQYNRSAMEVGLAAEGVRYVFMGDVLGGRPEEASLYVDGKVSYELLSRSAAYLSGIERLLVAETKGLAAAVMCSERDPRTCHRARLIGATLLQQGISLQHIDVDGAVRRQEDLLL